MDYARFGRQIALAEIGVAGQERLAEAALEAPQGAHPIATQLWIAAGGAGAPTQVAHEGGPAALGEAAWWCVESARRALGEDPREIPEALRTRLRYDVEGR